MLSFSVLVTGLPNTKKTGHKVKHACAHLGAPLTMLLAWCIIIAVIAIIKLVGHPAIYAFADGPRVKHFLSCKFTCCPVVVVLQVIMEYKCMSAFINMNIS